MPTPPVIVLLVNAVTPYRVHLHRRVARELPHFRVASLFTHEISNSPWQLDMPPEIGAVFFGAGEKADESGASPRREWAKGARLIAWLTANRPAIVILHGYNDLGRLRVLRWCRRQSIPCYLWGDSNIRGDNATGVKRIVKSLLLRWVLRISTGAMCCGTLGRDFFLKYGADPARIFFMPYEPDYDQIRNLPPERIAGIGARLNLSAARRRFVYSGRLVPEKRVDLVVDAFVAIADRRPDWDLLVLGTGPLRESLAARVPAALAGRVIWAGFLADQADVSAAYRTSDVLVHPSSYEPWALVINEAAAAGLAIVASDVVGAAAELVRDGVNGRTFPSGDLQALTAAMLDVTETPDITARLRAGSADVLAEWRGRGDPVEGLRQGMRAAGVTGV